MERIWMPMAVDNDGYLGKLLVEPLAEHDRALGVALSTARFPCDGPLPTGTRYVVYKGDKACDCKTCQTLDKEHLFDHNVCARCEDRKRDQST